MTDDPNRDILPVKEGSCTDTIFSAIDPRERHLVCKLDRYQLEDKYLRLLDEANNLKKLSNCQEDKIKRLGTKLIRLAGNPRSCGLTLDIADDRNRTSALELENTKLKEKIAVMRNQLLSHTMSSRSSSRSRNLARPTSSGFVTCRSENNRTRVPSCQCIVEAGHDDGDLRNYLVKIEKLEAQKKDMACRIAELGKELALYTAGSQREKVAENVEYIRVWRQMKQLNDKLITTQDKNAALTAEINDLKTTLEHTTRNNQEIAAVLTSERTRLAEIDDQMLKAKNSQLTLREKDEQMRDLISEMKILQQHNNELIALTSKYGQVELENIELRKKLSEHVHEQQTLKTAFNNEQTNIIALQTTNKQLLAKLQELQANIDTLTVQLASLDKQNGKRDVMTLSETSTIQNAVSEKQNSTSNFNKQPPTLVKQCKKCCEMCDKLTQLEKLVGTSREDWQSADKSVQTITAAASMREQGTMTLPEDEEKIHSRSQSPLKEWKTNQETNGTSVLSREKILKLLDQAQINVPLDASRIAQKEEYTGILDVAQRHSDGEISSRTLHDESSSVQKTLRKKLASLENPNVTSSQVLLILFDVLQEYLLFSNAEEEASPSHQVSTIGKPLIDVNNNFTAGTRDIKQYDGDAEATRNIGADKYTAATSDKDGITNTDDYINEGTKTSNICTCDNVKKCNVSAESDCCTSRVLRSIAVCAKPTCEEGFASVSTKEVGLSTKETLVFFPRTYKKHKRSSYRDVSSDFFFCTRKTIRKPRTSISPRHPKCDLMCHLQKAEDPLPQQEKRKLPCGIKCQKNSVEVPACPTESLPLLITDRQGLVEIHISRLQLSTSAAKIPEEEDTCNLHVYISWDIWDEKTACTPRMKCPNLNFNSSSVYRIADLSSFLKNVLSEYLIFRVNMVRRNDTSYTFARAKVSIKDILDYPQNKLHYVVPVSGTVPCFCGINFGQLSLWIRLSCNVEMVEAFKKQCGIASLQDTPRAPPPVQKDTDDTPQRDVGPPTLVTFKDRDLRDSSESEVSDSRHLQPSLDSKFQRETEISDDEVRYIDSNNQESSSAINETNETSEEENRWITARKCPDPEAPTDDRNGRKESSALTESPSMVEFKALLTNAGSGVLPLGGSSSTIRDMSEILSERNWERYRQRSLLTYASTIRAKSLNVDAQDYQHDASNCQLEKDTIIIEIVSVLLFDESSVMQDDEIRLLYVEYSFLEHYGKDMETVSVEKPRTAKQEMVYNFRKKFWIDEKTHSAERNSLRAMLNESINPNVEFIVVSEPLPEENEIKECLDVGYAIFNIRAYALGDGSEDILLPIVNDRNKKIGVLKIIVLGFDAIRQCLTDVKRNHLK